MLHSPSQERSTLAIASHHTGKEILEVMMMEKQQIPLKMRRTSCFVIIVLNPNILERLVGDFLAILLKVEEVIMAVLLELELITLQQFLLEILPPLTTGLLARKN